MKYLPQMLVATLICTQIISAVWNGVTIVTPPCADFGQRVNDQFNSGILLAVVLWLGGFWDGRQS